MMKNQTLFALAVFMAAALPAFGQKVLTQKPGSTAIIPVETALNHLTVVELREPVLSVASGSQAFRVEWRGNKVFIEPTEANVSTNLFIWTKSGRLNYELEPAGQVAQMDFAIDQSPLPHPAIKAKVAKPDPHASGILVESLLLRATPVEMTDYKAQSGRVQLLIKDVIHHHDRLLIRYAVQNWTNQSFEITTPQVLWLESPRSPTSLVVERNLQLTDREAAKIESNGQVSLPVIHEELETPQARPGDEAVGIVEVKVPASGQGPNVLRLVLPDGRIGWLSATLVL